MTWCDKMPEWSGLTMIFNAQVLSFNVYSNGLWCTGSSYASGGFLSWLHINSLTVVLLQTKALTWFPMLDPFIPFIWWGEASVYEVHTGQLKHLADDLSTPHDGEIKQMELRDHPDGFADVKELTHIDGLVQERRNDCALAMELRLSCTNPSIYSWSR